MISEPSELVHFAVVARIDALGLRRSAVAKRLDISPALLSARLKALKEGGRDSTSATFVRDLQRFLQVTEASHSQRAGSELVAFRNTLMNRFDVETIRIPSTYFDSLENAGPARNADELLVRIACLVATRSQAHTTHEASQLRRSLDNDRVDRLIDELLTVVGTPRGEGSVIVTTAAALREWALPAIERHMKSPIGWRSWRIVARMLRLYEDASTTDALHATLFSEIRELLRRAVEGEFFNLSPGRVFFEEALRRTPGIRDKDNNLVNWQWDFVPTHLRRTAAAASEPWRRRLYCALCLARRQDTQDLALDLALRMLSEEEAGGGLEHGARELIATIDPTHRALRKRGRAIEELVADAINSTDTFFDEVPSSFRSATIQLVRHAVLSIDTTSRRTACDTLIAGNVADVASRFVASLASRRDSPEWMREIACVVLGYLREHESLEPLTAIAVDPTSGQSTRHAAVLAAGDVAFGPARLGAENKAKASLQRLLGLINARDDAQHEPRLEQAVTYSAIMMNLWRPPDPRTLPALKAVSKRRDELTSSLATWGIEQLETHAGDEHRIVPIVRTVPRAATG